MATGQVVVCWRKQNLTAEIAPCDNQKVWIYELSTQFSVLSSKNQLTCWAIVFGEHFILSGRILFTCIMGIRSWCFMLPLLLFWKRRTEYRPHARLFAFVIILWHLILMCNKYGRAQKRKVRQNEDFMRYFCCRISLNRQLDALFLYTCIFLFVVTFR